MDRAALDKQYNLRQAFPSAEADFARWRAASARVRATLPAKLDLAYGSHPRETLDFFPAGRPGRPILVFIHGGYWQAMDKSDSSFVAEGLAGIDTEEAVNVAVLNYPLAPEVRMDRIVASIRRALLWLWRQASALGANGEAIVVTGHSAGGHLTAASVLADWRALGGPAQLVKAGLPISGVFDLRPIRLCYLNDRLRLDPDEAERNSPLLQLSHIHGPLPPMAFAVGEYETDAFHDQQSAFVAAYAARGPVVTAITSPRVHHFDIVETLTKPGSELRGALQALLTHGGLAR